MECAYTRQMSRRFGIVLLASALGACGLIAGIQDIPEGSAPVSDGSAPSTTDGATEKDASASDGPVVGVDSGPLLPSCGAQRVVHLVAHTGGLAWFQLLLPVPAVVTANNPDYAIDDPKRFTSLGTTDHPLYMRNRGAIPFWVGTGKSPLPTVLVAGNNETHADNPTSAVKIANKNAIAYGAGLQRALGPKVPALTFGTVLFGTAPGSPTAVNVPDVKGAVAALVSVGYPEARLTPDPATVARWYGAGAAVKVTQLAQQLLFAANAFKLGAVGTVVIPAMNDDPHGAFADTGYTTTVANDLASVLAGFYTELATSFETNCGAADGSRLSLADNVVFLVNGDTFKDPFQRNGWPDGTPGGSNLLFVRSNGFMKAGWFGRLEPGIRTNFSPSNGLQSTDLAADSTAAAVNGLVWAISRGNAASVTGFDAAPYAGVRAP